MHSYILLIFVCLAHVKAKSISEVHPIESTSSKENPIKVTEVAFSEAFLDSKCEGGLCNGILERADKKCKKGEGLVSPLFGSDYCKACECRNDNNCTFKSSWSGVSDKTCLCEDGYEDHKGECIGTCKKNPCQNGGKCEMKEKDIECKCGDNFLGSRCEETLIISTTEAILPTKYLTVSRWNFTPTTSDVFIKVASTVVSTTKLSIEETTTASEMSPTTNEISSTYTDIPTETPPAIDPCATNPCKNDGVCKSKGEEFVCYCPSPFSGKYCEMDPCSNNPCENGGTCFVDGASFRCICRDPFVGKTCEANPCMWNPCKNGGICKLVNKSARCFCDNPYTGEFCEDVKGNGLTITMLSVVLALLVVLLMLVSCSLFQRIRVSKTSRA